VLQTCGHSGSLDWVICPLVRVMTFFFLPQETQHLTPQSTADMLTVQLISSTSAHLYLKRCGWMLDTILQSYFCIIHMPRTVPLPETRVNRGFQVPSLQCTVSMLLTAYSLLLFILLLQRDLIWAYARSIIYWILCL